MSTRRNAKYTPLDADGPLPLEMVRSVPAISRDPLTWLARTVDRYGDRVAFPMPRTPVLLVNSATGARHVLQGNHPNWTKATIQYGSLAAVTGSGLLTSDGPAWREHRRAVQPAFHPSGLPAIADVTVRALAGSSHWDGVRFAGGEPGERLVDADSASMRTMLDVVTACLFSQAAGSSADGERVITAVDAALHAVVARARSPLVGPLARIPTPAMLRQRRAVRVLDDACAALVAGRRAQGAGQDDLLSLLLAAQDAGVLDGAGVRDELVTMIIAGHETVASSLAWTIDLLATHPEVQARLHAELDAVLAGREPGWDDLAALPYLQAVVAESLRLFPPAWVITRRAAGPDVIDDVEVPAGTLVIVSPWLLHRRADEWPSPDRFDPARFLDGSEPGRRRAYLPFGAGPRLCIGREVALVQARLILARLLRDHALRRPPGTREPGVDALVTLRPKAGLPILLAPR